ncbi:hypothetical protein [Anaeromicropila herbilytica]|uniref:Uncharacterized protein n=1 Tax=Anaeromicropila herbilytica TaxID=2785025 RepID=A0A7R7ID43_9FIRM|nr:hypothetical protein [Anaeromicropila herbilytica]BCN30516.1 hypothetical protein bsdtb5_18110 [Anaeromicropila herbilytica]
MATFTSFEGRINSIEDFYTSSKAESGCTKLISVVNREGAIFNFVVTTETYFINHVTVQVGDIVVAFYDTSLPAPMIYPPQFRAVVIGIVSDSYSIAVDFFNKRLTNRTRTLQLNIGPETIVMLTNDQLFSGSPGNHNLAVLYDITTRSIPAQTTPLQVIVLCYNPTK